MIRALQGFGQIAVYGAFAVLIGYFADSPHYEYFPSDKAAVTLSFAHGAEHKGDCRRLSRTELQKLAPNMRKPVSCPRERLPVVVKLELDGRNLYEATLPPTGLSGDGPSHVFKRFVVPTGRHTLVARLRDTKRESGYDYTATKAINLAPAQSLAIDFRADIGGFIFE